MTSRKKFLQQTGFALAGSLIPYSKLLANNFKFRQNTTTLDTYHPVDCSVDLATSYKYTYSTNAQVSQIAVLDGYYSYPDGANNTTNPFSNDVQYSAETPCNPPTTHCSNVDLLNQNPYIYKVYFPKETIHDYVNRPLPVYILFHAGGFQECTTYELPIIKNLCIELARKGWICFTVEYRRGLILDTIDSTKTSVQQQFARYRAIQDGCGAIRSIIKKNRAGDPERFPFTIDETQVFVGGTSAGGIIALGSAYYRTSADLVSDQSMIDQVFPQASGSTYSIKQVLGNMHANYYYAPVDAQYWPKIVGVASLWGGIVIPKSYDGASNESDYAVVEKTFFETDIPGANPPLICFHGFNDLTIPFKDNTSQNMDLSPHRISGTDYNSENFCTVSGNTFIQKGVTGIELKMCSSLNLYLIMRQLNRFSEFYLDCQMAHGLDDDCYYISDPTCYQSDFGTGAHTQKDTTIYMAARIAVFSQAIMANYPSVLLFGAKGRSYFKECENDRKCTETNNNACGTGGNTLCDGTPIPE